MKTLQDFQNAAHTGGKITRRFPNSPEIQPQTSIIACVYPDSLIFSLYSLEIVELHKMNLDEHLKFIREAPELRGLHFDWPAPDRYRIEDGELIIHDEAGRDYLALRVEE